MALSKGASIAIVTVICLVFGVLIGFLVGWFSRAPHDAVILRHVPSKLVEDADNEIRDKILSYVDTEKLREYSREHTSESHLAGTKTDEENAKELLRFWKNLGFDADIKSYDVLLTYPSGSIASNNFVSWADGGYQRTRAYEPQIGKYSYPGQIVTPFNAYSSSGNVFGELVYVNYGRAEDFELLENEYSVNFTNRIVIARYGKCYRGDKVKNAERWKAAGIILFTAPADYAPDEWKGERYPKGIFMPPHGVQRGSVLLAKGDPETPGYPSLEGAYRESKEDIYLPTIPVLPISYSDARQLLRNKEGNSFEEYHLAKINPLPSSWDHKLGIPEGRDVGRFYEWHNYGSSYSRKVNLTVNVTKTIRKINNVQATIKGQVEEDRYVIIGNHRDAWVYGAVDPSSGTAVLKEVSRVLSKLIEEGWQPRRSILLCSWSGEEQSLIGSYEWAEEFSHLISNRAVAYVNVDSAVRGNQTFRGRAMPLLKDLMVDVASHIPDPNSTDENPIMLIDTWKSFNPSKNSVDQPKVEPLTPTSDNAVFMSRLGISSVDISYDYGPESYPFDKYPLYHTRYDTFDLMERYMDPNFQIHATVAKYTLEFVRRLSDNYVLPFKPSTYAKDLLDELKKYEKHIGFSYEAYTPDIEPAINRLNGSLIEFLEKSIEFEDNLSDLNKDNPILIRRMNDRLVEIERCFLDYQGLPGNRLSNHLISSQSIHESHKVKFLPGLYDVTYEASRRMQYNLKIKKWKMVLKHLSILTGFVKQAAKTLNRSFI